MSLAHFEDNPFYIGCLVGLFFAFYVWNIVQYFSRSRQNRRGFEDLAFHASYEFFESKWVFDKQGVSLPEAARPHNPFKPPLSLGPDWGCRNILRGLKDGREFLLLERDYQDRDLKGIAETLALFGKPGAGLPYFEIVPRRLFDKFHRRLELEMRDQAVQMKRLEAEGLGHFERPSHYLWGAASEEDRVRALLGADFWAYLELFPNWRLKASKDWVVVFEENILVAPEKAPGFIEQGSRAAGFLFGPAPR